MKTRILVVMVGALMVVSGCVNTVDGRKTAGVPWIKDSIEGRYERPPEEIVRAAKEVISRIGVVNNEGTIYVQDNQTGHVRTVEGKVNQRSVWVRIETISPTVTAVTVQTRTRGGGTDIDLAHQIDKEIALKLVH
jgi:hypothetical protein